MLDLLRFAIAILPLAAYTQILGLLCMRTKPTVLNGAMDFLLLGLAVIGFVAIGPIELFFPRAAYSILGPWVWVVLLSLYFFVIMLIALNSNFKLVVYGVESFVLKSAIQEILKQEQIESTWVNDIVEVPSLGVRACVEKAGRVKLSKLEAVGRSQNPTGWYTLERLLVKRLDQHKTNQHAQAFSWIATSLLLFGISVTLISSDLPRLKQAIAILFDRD